MKPLSLTRRISTRIGIRDTGHDPSPRRLELRPPFLKHRVSPNVHPSDCGTYEKTRESRARADRWEHPGTGFAIEDSQHLPVKRAIDDGRCNRFGLGRHKCLLEKVRDKRLELKEFEESRVEFVKDAKTIASAFNVEVSNAAGHDAAINIVN